MAVAAAFLTSTPTANAAGIDAVRGKQYQITKRHGPWMIMVASFTTPVYKTEGMSPDEAADELVYELRKQGIPAYKFTQDRKYDRVDTVDRVGRRRMRAYAAQDGNVCVLAGNYKNSEDKVAQKTLAYIKRFHPEYLRSVQAQGEALMGRELRKLKNGGIFRTTPNRPGPLSGAFLTFNPLLDDDDVQKHRRDPLLLKLNAGMDYSLLESSGKYTVVVASFYGKSLTTVPGQGKEDLVEEFETGTTLDAAAEDAVLLARTLRSGKTPVKSQTGGADGRKFEAYVYHERDRSVVTVGSFANARDPEIARLQKMFGAKIKEHPSTHRNVLVAEMLTLPATRRRPSKSWIFDPSPELLETPRIR